MTETNPFANKIRESAGLRLAVLFGSFFILMLLVSICNAIIGSLPIGTERDHILWGSVLQNILAFMLPAYLVARFCSKDAWEWLKLTPRLNLKPFLGVLIVYVITLPAMEFLIGWNESIHFPESLSGLEKSLRELEDASQAMVHTLLDTSGFLPVMAGVLVIGVLTGLAEEMFFRGGMQGILTRSKISPAMAIWLTAILFSTMHFQFYGFFPRLLMGVFFGYLLIWTGDLKVAAFAHILNNSVVVVISSITGCELITAEGEGLFSSQLPLSGISLIISIIFFIFFRGYFFKIPSKISVKSEIPESREELPA